MSGFRHVVKVDGSDIAPITLAGLRITYGRSTLLEQPSLPTAVIDILTRDALPDAAMDYPEFGLGDWASDLSGFTDAYGDAYEGVTSRITLGVPVQITAGTASGFTDAYEDSYNGADMVRFTGSCNAIDYDAGVISLTATPQTAESWSRLMVGATSASQTIPAETETARMQRLATEGGVALIVDGPPSVVVRKIVKKTAAKSLMAWLTEIARDTRAVVFTNRAGWVNVRTKDYVAPDKPIVPLTPGSVLIDPLRMKAELGGVRNDITVEYGDDNANGDQPTVTSLDQESVDRYGRRDVRYSTIINTQADAQSYADWLNVQLSPAWTMPDVVVAVSLLDGATTYDVLNIEQGDTVTVSGLPLGAPEPTYTAQALGYTETLSYDDWQISFHLSPLTGSETL